MNDQTVVGDVSIGGSTLGQWCPLCRLPSAVLFDLVVVWVSVGGVSAPSPFGSAVYCLGCQELLTDRDPTTT